MGPCATGRESRIFSGGLRRAKRDDVLEVGQVELSERIPLPSERSPLFPEALPFPRQGRAHPAPFLSFGGALRECDAKRGLNRTTTLGVDWESSRRASFLPVPPLGLSVVSASRGFGKCSGREGMQGKVIPPAFHALKSRPCHFFS